MNGIQPLDRYLEELAIVERIAALRDPLARVSSPQAFDEQKSHLLTMYRNVKPVHSFRDTAGQIFDCVPIEKQPALKGGTIPLAAPPQVPRVGAVTGPKEVGALFGIGIQRRDAHGNPMSCPPGTVAIKRLTLNDLARFETLGHFFRKGPRLPRPQIAPTGLKPVLASAGHAYAYASQLVNSFGGQGVLNVWSPAVADSQSFSLSQHWYVGGVDALTQTAEVGWQVYPQKYGHTMPVLFTYWTADAYASTGAYNNDASQFVQYGPNCPIGVAFEQSSLQGGSQVEIEVSFFLSDGKWWLFLGGTGASNAVGYYPTTLYEGGQMASNSTRIEFGGETVGPNLYPPMGSGAFSSEGYKEAAYQRSLLYFDLAQTPQPVTLASSQTWPSIYTIELQDTDDWGRALYFGGPGGVPPQ